MVVQIAPELEPALERLEGKTLDEKLARLIANELRRYLEQVEREVLEFEIKYGFNYEQFAAQLERGELGDPFAYEREQDAIKWESLLAEKQAWLEQLRRVKSLAIRQLSVLASPPERESPGTYRVSRTYCRPSLPRDARNP